MVSKSCWTFHQALQGSHFATVSKGVQTDLQFFKINLWAVTNLKKRWGEGHDLKLISFLCWHLFGVWCLNIEEPPSWQVRNGSEANEISAQMAQDDVKWRVKVRRSRLKTSPSAQKYVFFLLIPLVRCLSFTVQNDLCAEFDTRWLFSH